LNYLLTDHLGSVATVTVEDGALLSEQRYLPFGQVRPDVGSVTQTDFGYTGQRDLDAQENTFSLGLMDYDARFYDVSLSRFTQPDTIVPGAGNPQALNRFAYALNMPMNIIDPSGHYGICPGTITPTDDGFCGKEDFEEKSAQPSLADPTIPAINDGKKDSNQENFTPKPWQYTVHHATYGVHVGPTGDIHVPNYDDDQYNGLPYVSNKNAENNFWISFDIVYDESVGISISNIMIVNYSEYPVAINGVKFENNDQSIRLYSELFGKKLLHGFGSDFSFPSPPTPFYGNDQVAITIEMEWFVEAGHGPFPIFPDFQIVLPSLPDLRYYLETGHLRQPTLYYP
jgi:RHS repeat-associated protein